MLHDINKNRTYVHVQRFDDSANQIVIFFRLENKI